MIFLLPLLIFLAASQAWLQWQLFLVFRLSHVFHSSHFTANLSLLYKKKALLTQISVNLIFEYA
jgi:hypothetical protein